MAAIVTYSTEKHSAEELIEHMTVFLTEHNMNTQRVDSSDGSLTVIQARISGGSVKQFIGMDKAVTLRFTRGNSLVNVEVGEAKWADKATVMTLSMFVLCPLTITSGIGIYGQRKLMKEIPEEMHSFMTNTALESKSGLISRGLTAVSNTVKKTANILTDSHNVRTMQMIAAKMGPVISRELIKIMSR